MEINSGTRAKRLWNLLRVAFLMVRKGFTPKRKLVMDLNLMMKRGKLFGRSFRSIVFPHRAPAFRGFGPQDYEFSCTNSPDPLFFHGGAGSATKRKLHYYFPSLPCINPPHADDSDDHVIVNRPQFDMSNSDLSSLLDPIDLADGEKISPAISPLPIVISSYYPSEDDEYDATDPVDEKAEEFIARFYEQLRSQGRLALLQYQEMEYQAMLARGCS
ncbi:uncharacterized protein LOC116257832 [Nymphaea colorata]|uniref:Uncharacterized protein n=1 Tax=Nymphaea colorata TaxID=210225 RepID=A0A5K1F5Q2_9MAGN|nr:uncharacterized protein LOC116257832 [Nymphaea colorata]VVW58815.1 unnamed protein product [Nymphaea colorata]